MKALMNQLERTKVSLGNFKVLKMSLIRILLLKMIPQAVQIVLLHIMEDVVNKGSNNVLMVSGKLVEDDTKDCGENLLRSSQDGMSGNVFHRCEGTENPANLETKPEPAEIAYQN
jgi:hypothetical protein